MSAVLMLLSKARRQGKPLHTLELIICFICFSMIATQTLVLAAIPPYTPTGSALDLVMADPAYSLLGAAIMDKSIISPEVFAVLQSPTKGKDWMSGMRLTSSGMHCCSPLDWS